MSHDMGGTLPTPGKAIPQRDTDQARHAILEQRDEEIRRTQGQRESIELQLADERANLERIEHDFATCRDAFEVAAQLCARRISSLEAGLGIHHESDGDMAENGPSYVMPRVKVAGDRSPGYDPREG